MTKEILQIMVFTRGDRVELNPLTTGWVQYNNGCAFTANINANSISSVKVLEEGNLNLINSTAEVLLPNPKEPRFSSDGRFMYVFSADAQPAIHVYEIESIERTCGLTEVQVISDGIPNAATTVFGATGTIAVF
mgnify:CR=1 FL=1